MERVERTATTTAPAATTRPVEYEDEVDLIPVRTYWQLVRMRFLQHRLAVMAVVLMAILIALAIIVPTMTGNAYTKTSLTKVNLPPSLEYPLGTSDIGQNVFLRLMKALQTSLFIGFTSVAIIALVGVSLGAVAGFFGGGTDNMIMRFVDIILSLPTFFLIIMIVAFFGGVGNATTVIVAIGITGWTVACRLVRAEFLRLRDADYVQAARALGAGDRRIAVRHMLPAALPPIVVACALGIADSVVTEAALSYLGFGIQPPAASLGNMMTNALDYFFRAPYLILYPGITLILIVLSASFIGDGLRDALDPRQRIESK